MSIRTRTSFTLLIVAAIFIAALFILKSNNGESDDMDTQPETEMQASNEESTPQSAAEEVTETTPEVELNDESVKQSNPALPASDEKPRIFTSFGHSSENPLQLSQQTSTSCTASPNSGCSIVFTNQTSSQVVTFDEQLTNEQGVAIWSWRGSSVGSGTWDAIAISGALESDKEVLFIQ